MGTEDPSPAKDDGIYKQANQSEESDIKAIIAAKWRRNSSKQQAKCKTKLKKIVVKTMGRQKRFKNSPKLWERKNGRLCRCDLLDQPEFPSDKTTSVLVNILSSQPRQPDYGKEFSVLDLPEECLIIVLKNLEFFEICNVARVCKRFYQVSLNPTLWRSVDLSSVYNFRISSLNLDCLSGMMTFPKRRMLLASFLCARSAALTDIHGEVNICREAEMFHCLLNCNVKNLQRVKLRMPHGINYLTYIPGVGGLQALRDVLSYLVQKCCNSLKYLKCYVDISYTTAKLLGSLRSLEHLNVQFLNPWAIDSDKRYLQPEALDAILSSLPNLKYLKISIRQDFDFDPNYFPCYILKSDSLEVLDFGHTKQFFIKKMILPKLHTIEAECLWNFHNTQSIECFYDIVERGCPQIRTLNRHTSLVPGLQNFNLGIKQKRDLYFCGCPNHEPLRAFH